LWAIGFGSNGWERRGEAMTGVGSALGLHGSWIAEIWPQYHCRAPELAVMDGGGRGGAGDSILPLTKDRAATWWPDIEGKWRRMVELDGGSFRPWIRGAGEGNGCRAERW
jgi:hypothetical protein